MSGYTHFAGVKSSDVITVGPSKGADVFNYTDLEAAFAAMVPGGVMHIYPGTYSLTETLTVDYACDIYGIGNVTINGGTDGIEDRLVMLNKPPAGTAVTIISFYNIKFVNAYSAADVIEIDNDGGATGHFKPCFYDCSFDSNAGLSFDIDQTTNTILMYVYISGHRAAWMVMDGMNVAFTLAASILEVRGYDFQDQVIALGTTNVAWILQLSDCVYQSEAFTTGGSASAILNMIGCAKMASAAISAPVIEDSDATFASENIQNGVLDT